MIKQIYVCECDICGATENAKAVTWRNETEYEIPDNWVRSNNRKVCICPECSKKLNAKPTEPTIIPTMPVTPVYGCPVAHEEGYTTTIGTGVTVDPIVILVGTPKTESQIVLDAATSESSVLRDSLSETAKDPINTHLYTLKVYCDSQDSCSTCPIAYFEEKPEYWHCSLTNTPVFEWQNIANKLMDEHKTLAESIEMIANHCRDDVRNCEDCRYCRSFERCDLRLHNPADWVIYENIKEEK